MLGRDPKVFAGSSLAGETGTVVFSTAGLPQNYRASSKNLGNTVVFRKPAATLASTRKWGYKCKNHGKTEAFWLFGLVEGFSHTVEVTGSNPVPPTLKVL
jgi:hypothetical protein